MKRRCNSVRALTVIPGRAGSAALSDIPDASPRDLDEEGASG